MRRKKVPALSPRRLPKSLILLAVGLQLTIKALMKLGVSLRETVSSG